MRFEIIIELFVFLESEGIEEYLFTHEKVGFVVSPAEFGNLNVEFLFFGDIGIECKVKEKVAFCNRIG